MSVKEDVWFQLENCDAIEISLKLKGDRQRYLVNLNTIDDSEIRFRLPQDENDVNVNPEESEEKPMVFLTGRDGYQYRFLTSIQKATSSFFSVDFPDELHKEPLRNDVRIDCSLNIDYWLAPDQPVYKFQSDEKEYKGIITNISAGGAFLTTTSKVFFKNSMIEFKINSRKVELEDVITAKIIRVKLLNKTKGLYGFPVMFTNIIQKDKEAIVKWIFKEQVAQKKIKG